MAGPARVASESQRAAIEAEPGPLLVLAGPGAGKTFCLIERIRFLIEERSYDPARICAFTFTNRAAEEIAERLERQLGARADRVKRGTIHAFCAEVLREFGPAVGVESGFGIADDVYQRAILRRLRVPASRWHRKLLTRFTLHRFRNDPLHHKDAAVFQHYEQFLARRNVVDFDALVLKTLDVFQRVPDAAAALRDRWAYVLVDEFQDLNRAQYAVVRALTRDHGKVFAVGDDEQSIYSWAGAERDVFPEFVNDAQIVTPIHLQDNHRCPREVFALARRLVMRNPPIFAHREHAEPVRDSAFPVTALSFATDEDETRWMLSDLLREHIEHGLGWGDIAVLYRTHQIGDAAEVGFLAAGIPCRLAVGRAFADDPVVAYVLAALRVIASSDDSMHHEGFFAAVLPKALVALARAGAEEHGESVVRRLNGMTRELGRTHGDAQKIRRGFYALRNLSALGARHTSLGPLVEELLSQRVGEYRTVLEEHFDELSDPLGHPDVVCLAEQLEGALETGRPVWIPRLGGVEIAIKGILAGVGLSHVVLGGLPPEDAIALDVGVMPEMGAALGVFRKPLSPSRAARSQTLSAISPQWISRRRGAASRVRRSSSSAPCASATARSWPNFNRWSNRESPSSLGRRERTGSQRPKLREHRCSRRCGQRFATSVAATCWWRTTATTSISRSCAAWRWSWAVDGISRRTTRCSSRETSCPPAESSPTWR